MTGIEKLPIEVYLALRAFLKIQDYICLMNATKLLEGIKIKSVIFELNKKFSKIFLHNETFKNNLVDSITDCHEQIILNLQDEIIFPNSVVQDHKILKELPKGKMKNQVIEYKIGAGRKFSCSAMKRMILHHCISINMDFIQLLTEVHLIDCPEIKDISCLRNVRTLYLTRCHGITDVSALNKVHSLHLSSCDGISDITDLTDNSTLSVMNCSRVMDFSNVKRTSRFSLEHSHFLQLVGLPKRIHEMIFTRFPEISFGLKVLTLKFEFISILQLINCLHLTECPVAFLTTSIQKIIVQNCENLQDVTALGNIPIISISSCNRLRSLTGLSKHGNQEVSLNSCRSIHNFSNLNGMKKVSIQNCVGFRHAKELKEVSHLIIENCWSVESVSGVGGEDSSLHCLELINNCKLFQLDGIQDIPVVILQLGKAMDLSFLKSGKNEKLVFTNNSNVSSFPSQRSLLDRYTWESYQDREVYLKRRSISSVPQKKPHDLATSESSVNKTKKPPSTSTGILTQCICN